MKTRQKISKIIGNFLIIPMILFVIWGINEMAKMRFIYGTTFVDNAIIVIPENVYSSIKSENIILRVNKIGEYQTYTSKVTVGEENFVQTNTTRNGHSHITLQSSVFNGEIPRTKAFEISVSPKSIKPFKLKIYDKRW